MVSVGEPPTIEEIENEGKARRLRGRTGTLATGLSVALALYALYWVLRIVQPQIYRVSFLLISLVLIFLLFRGTRAAATRPTILDWALVGLSVVALTWPIVDFEAFVYRAATPLRIDVALGIVTLALVLEAARRTVGLILPLTAMAFLAYGYYGAVLDRVGLSIIGHRGYPVDRLVATLYMTLEGIFGVPVDVAATYIVLFVIYGAILEHSGAGRFFVDWTLAAVGRSGGAGPGRTIAVAGYLLGCVSGSGVANTVTLAAVAWPMLRRAGYTPEAGGAILAASGIGAIFAPPVMGAAAFLIAEFLRISFLQVVIMAAIPAVLYYAAILLTIEAESRRLDTSSVAVVPGSLARLTRQYGYHFVSLLFLAFAIVRGMTAVRAVFWATLVAIGLSFIRAETALGPRRLVAALAAAGRGVVPVVATTAVAGIIVGVVTLTGLGLKVSGIIVTLAGESVALTVVYAAVAVWVLGLAVPVTASYIIAAVMIAPALTEVGIPPTAAHMFIFYYAVLSEVSPPTALSPFAAAAVTGGDPMRTTFHTWKYTIPAFVVPFMFTLNDRGRGLLLQAPWTDVVLAVTLTAVSLACFAGAACGWIRREATVVERAGLAVSGAFLAYGSRPTLGLAALVIAATIGFHWVRTGRDE